MDETKIGLVLAMPAIRIADRRESLDLVRGWFSSTRPEIAEAFPMMLEEDGAIALLLMQGTSSEILLEAPGTGACREGYAALARLAFRDRPFALVRIGRHDGRPVVSCAISTDEKCVEEIVGEVLRTIGRADPRPGLDTLLDFGRNAVLDLGRGELRILTSRRLCSVMNRASLPQVAVLDVREDGVFQVGSCDGRGRQEWRNHTSRESALKAVEAAIDRAVKAIRGNERDEFLMLHRQSDSACIDLSWKSREKSIVREVSGKPQREEMSTTEAMDLEKAGGIFRARCGEMLDGILRGVRTPSTRSS